MKLFVKVKALGKRRPVLEMQEIFVEEGIKNSNDLISDIVRKNVKIFNEKKTDKPIFSFLTDEKISDAAFSGKVGFGDKKNENLQNENSAVENALQCYEDGIFKLLINDNEIEFNSEIVLNEEDILIFIRLTMLAGRLW